MFRQAVQDIISCNVGLARRREAFRSLALAGKTESVPWPRGFLESDPKCACPRIFSSPTTIWALGVLSSHGG